MVAYKQSSNTPCNGHHGVFTGEGVFVGFPSFTAPAQERAHRAPQWRWNPYADTPLPSLLTSGVVAEEAMTIPALVQRYEQQVTALVKSHEDILCVKSEVQRAINDPRSSGGKTATEEDSVQLEKNFSVLSLLKQGLDIQIRQFAENCQRASKLEWALHRKLRTPADRPDALKQSVPPFQVQHTCLALKKIQDQDRLIKLLQHVLDQNLYYNHIFAEKLRHMRKKCFVYELNTTEALPGGCIWFEGRQIEFKAEAHPQSASRWMQLIRTHPSARKIPPPPRADPRSLQFISKVHEIDQLAGTLAKEAHAFSEITRRRNLTELCNQLSRLRKVLAGAGAAASGIEKVILKELTTHVDEQLSYGGPNVARSRDDGKGQARLTGTGMPNLKRETKPVALETAKISEKARTASDAGGWPLPEIIDKRAASTASEVQRSSSMSLLWRNLASRHPTSEDVLSKIPSKTVPSARRSVTCELRGEEEKVNEVAATSRNIFPQKKSSLSSLQSSPHSSRLYRGASRTLQSPRQSFAEDLPPAQSGGGDLTENYTDKSSFPARSVGQRHEEDKEDIRSVRPSAHFRTTLLRGGSRTVASPRRDVSRESLTSHSAREQQTSRCETPLTRAMSSAFLGG